MTAMSHNTCLGVLVGLALLPVASCTQKDKAESDKANVGVVSAIEDDLHGDAGTSDQQRFGAGEGTVVDDSSVSPQASPHEGGGGVGAADEQVKPGAAKRVGDACTPEDRFLDGAPPDAACITAASYPYGYWTWSCDDDRECGSENRCVSNNCVRPCAGDDECMSPTTCADWNDNGIPFCLCAGREDCQSPTNSDRARPDAE
jgi:hypothetical protein